MLKTFFRDKHPILGHFLRNLIKTFIIGSAAIALVFGILIWTGLYEKIEIALDIRYNSSLITIPLYAFAGVAVVGLVIGILLYFHKYKRVKTRSLFGDKLKEVLQKEERG